MQTHKIFSGDDDVGFGVSEDDQEAEVVSKAAAQGNMQAKIQLDNLQTKS